MLGGETCAGTDFATRPPVILVGLAAHQELDPSRPTWPASNGKLYYAVIDTGATNTAIDQTAAKEIGATVYRYTRVHGWKGGESETEVTKIHVLLSEAGAVFCDEAAIRDFRGDEQHFDLLLGRTFLRYCRFSLDGPNSRYHLEWIGPPTS